MSCTGQLEVRYVEIPITMTPRDFIQECWKSGDATRFPGPQPVSIERKHFHLLKRQPYLVCEKTDGIRLLLASTATDTVIVNRSFSIQSIKPMRIPKDTLLDGELVRVSGSDRMLFLVFDAVRVKGEDLRALPLNERLNKARALLKGVIKTSKDPFEIRVKSMVSLENIRSLPTIYEYETDGLVMTPVNEPVQTGTHETMFKWKPRERITVDFCLKSGSELYVQDRGVLYKESDLHIQNKRLDLADGTIVECGYGKLGWFVEKVRTDKSHPNNRRTYFNTVSNIREDIKITEF